MGLASIAVALEPPLVYEASSFPAHKRTSTVLEMSSVNGAIEVHVAGANRLANESSPKSIAQRANPFVRDLNLEKLCHHLDAGPRFGVGIRG